MNKTKLATLGLATVLAISCSKDKDDTKTPTEVEIDRNRVATTSLLNSFQNAEAKGDDIVKFHNPNSQYGTVTTNSGHEATRNEIQGIRESILNFADGAIIVSQKTSNISGKKDAYIIENGDTTLAATMYEEGIDNKHIVDESLTYKINSGSRKSAEEAEEDASFAKNKINAVISLMD